MSTGRLAGWLSRRVGAGAGSVITGRVAMALHPGVLAGLAAGRTSIVVTGTNGKTTTSHLIAAALAGRGTVAHNAAGSNMLDGAVAALIGAPRAHLAVLEVDELHLAAVCRAVQPDVVVVLNLTRDQLDRISEIRHTATVMRRALAELPETIVVANADDPMVVWGTRTAVRLVWVSPTTSWQADTLACPSCGHQLSRTPTGPAANDHRLAGRRTDGVEWCCPGCGLTRPGPSWCWHADPGGRDTDRITVEHPGPASVALRLGLPGRVNRDNATFALAAAAQIGTDPAVAASALAGVVQVAGRYAHRSHRGRRVRLLLVKNPAGWGEALDMLTPGRPLLIVINAAEADGRDVSWLWDLPVGGLDGRPIAVAGSRAADLGVRLTYSAITHRTEPDPRAALEHLPAGDVDALANYTAFLELQHRLGPDTGGRPTPAPQTPPVPAPRAPVRVPAPRRRRESTVAIAVLLPDVLGTYSDAGNAAVLERRLAWRGIEARILEITADQTPPAGCELYVIGGGEDTAQHAAAEWLRRHRPPSTALAERAVTLAVCAGLQLLGHASTDLSGLSRPGLGLLDLTTRPGATRTVGESVSTSTIPGVGALTGFHNHRGVSLLGPHAAALGHVVHGPGNHPDTGDEGAVSPCPSAAHAGPAPGIVATYLHGPVLARNPALADHLLVRALGGPLPDLDLERIADLPALRHTYLHPGTR